jgi:hypothetical protein
MRINIMRNILLGIIFCFFSCGQQKQAEMRKDTTSQKLSIDNRQTANINPADSTLYTILPDSVVQTSPDRDPMTAWINHIYNDNLYKKAIPDSVFRLIHKHLPQWKFSSPERFDTFFFNYYYEHENALVNYIKGDFNCDGKIDYALVLENKNKDYAVWVLQSGPASYSAIKLSENMKQDAYPISVGLELIPRGKLGYLNFDDGPLPEPIELKCNAIDVMHFEESSQAYYWNKNKYESVPTSD